MHFMCFVLFCLFFAIWESSTCTWLDLTMSNVEAIFLLSYGCKRIAIAISKNKNKDVIWMYFRQKLLKPSNREDKRKRLNVYLVYACSWWACCYYSFHIARACKLAQSKIFKFSIISFKNKYFKVFSWTHCLAIFDTFIISPWESLLEPLNMLCYK